MSKKKLEVGQEITINVPFTYTIGEEGYRSGNILNTIEDCENEVRAEIDYGDLNSQNIMLEMVPINVKK